MNRKNLPLLDGQIGTAFGVIRFQFVATAGTEPAVLLTNAGIETTFAWGRLELQVRMLARLTPRGWERGDAAEPQVVVLLTGQPVNDDIRQMVHDELLGSWRKYIADNPTLPDYSRFIEVNNRLWVIESKLRELDGESKRLQLERAKLLQEESTLGQVLAGKRLSDHAVSILNLMIQTNSWVSISPGQSGSLHPYNSPETLQDVSAEAVRELVDFGAVKLHRILEGGRKVYRVAGEKGRETANGSKN